ncbi:hypothetical protein FRC04_008119 [Tulasnella sp. 424]|nr:hypothetical protein FRC04_008119 [Tulasnella sp. 424]KAG8974776.1 hypothetical protein FRC05_006937 [Tulasnella sp. 425]
MRIIQAARTNRQRLFCPKCRAPFREGPPDVFHVYPEYESDEGDISATHNRSLTTQDRQDVEQLAARAENIGIESEAADLEGLVARGEQLFLRFKDGAGGDDNGEILTTLEERLGQLRQRLSYHHRLESLKDEVTRLAAERDQHRDALDTQHAKYLEAKDRWRAVHQKYSDRKEQCTLLSQGIQERDALILNLQNSLSVANGKLMKQNMTINKANGALEDEVAKLKEKLEKHERDKLKSDKKYMAAKSELHELQRKHAKCKRSRPYSSSEVDDSLEIILPPKPAPLRASASSSSLHLSTSNKALQKSNSTSAVLKSLPTEPKRSFARVASLPSTSRDLENVQPPTDGDWEDPSMLSPLKPASSRSKPKFSPNLTNSLVSKSVQRKAAPFPFMAPYASGSSGKGKARGKNLKAPIDSNGKPKRKVTKSRSVKLPNGFMRTEEYSSYESASDDEPMIKPGEGAVFTAPRTSGSRSKGKEPALPSSEPEIQEIGVHIPSMPAPKRRKVSNEAWA